MSTRTKDIAVNELLSLSSRNAFISLFAKGRKGQRMGGRKRGSLAVLSDAFAATGGRDSFRQAWRILCENDLQHLTVGFGLSGLLVLLYIARLLHWANLTSLQWNLLLTFIALAFNILLSSFQMIVILNLNEFSKVCATSEAKPSMKLDPPAAPHQGMHQGMHLKA